MKNKTHSHQKHSNLLKITSFTPLANSKWVVGNVLFRHYFFSAAVERKYILLPILNGAIKINKIFFNLKKNQWNCYIFLYTLTTG